MRITSIDGEIVDIGEPMWVREDDDGVWRPCGEADAQAISVRGDLCGLAADREVPDHPDAPVAIVWEAPDGSLTLDSLRNVRLHATRIGDLEEGLCDAATVLEDSTVDIEEAACEQATAMAGLVSALDARVAALEAAADAKEA